MTTPITIKSVIENTKCELVDNVNIEELTLIVNKIHEFDGVAGIKEFENNVTIMHETGNVDGLMNYMEELMDDYL